MCKQSKTVLEGRERERSKKNVPKIKFTPIDVHLIGEERETKKSRTEKENERRRGKEGGEETERETTKERQMNLNSIVMMMVDSQLT